MNARIGNKFFSLTSDRRTDIERFLNAVEDMLEHGEIISDECHEFE